MAPRASSGCPVSWPRIFPTSTSVAGSLAKRGHRSASGPFGKAHASPAVRPQLETQPLIYTSRSSRYGVSGSHAVAGSRSPKHDLFPVVLDDLAQRLAVPALAPPGPRDAADFHTLSHGTSLRFRRNQSTANRRVGLSSNRQSVCHSLRTTQPPIKLPPTERSRMNTPLIERSPSGSGMIVKTIGIDDVARPAANVSRGLVVTMTSTFALTRLAARGPQQKIAHGHPCLGELP